jgi:hypothetical protein
MSELIRWIVERVRGPVCDEMWPMGGIGCCRPATHALYAPVDWWRDLRFCARHAPPHARPRGGDEGSGTP